MELILSAPLCDDCYHEKFFREWKVEKPKRKKIMPLWGGKQIKNFEGKPDPIPSDNKTGSNKKSER